MYSIKFLCSVSYVVKISAYCFISGGKQAFTTAPERFATNRKKTGDREQDIEGILRATKLCRTTVSEF